MIKITGIGYVENNVNVEVTYDHEELTYILEKLVTINILLGLTETQIVNAVKNQVAVARRNQTHVAVENKLNSLLNVDLDLEV